MNLEDVKQHLMKESDKLNDQIREIEDHAKDFGIPSVTLGRDVSYVSIRTKRDTLRELLRYLMKNS